MNLQIRTSDLVAQGNQDDRIAELMREFTLALAVERNKEIFQRSSVYFEQGYRVWDLEIEILRQRPKAEFAQKDSSIVMFIDNCKVVVRVTSKVHPSVLCLRRVWRRYIRKYDPIREMQKIGVQK